MPPALKNQSGDPIPVMTSLGALLAKMIRASNTPDPFPLRVRNDRALYALNSPGTSAPVGLAGLSRTALAPLAGWMTNVWLGSASLVIVVPAAMPVFGAAALYPFW